MRKSVFFGNSPVLEPAMDAASPKARSGPYRVVPATQVSFASGGGNEERPVIDVGRRRRDDSSGPRERADTPQRQRDNGGSSGSGWGTPSSGGGSGSSGGGGGGFNLPTGGGSGGSTGGMSVIGVVVLIIIAAIGYFFFGGSSSTPTDTTNTTDNTTDNTTNNSGTDTGDTTQGALPTSTPFGGGLVTAVPAPTRAGAGTGKGDKWLVMLYQDADDSELEQDVDIDLNEAERAGSDNNVQIVSQLDRYKAGFSGDGNYTTARRYYVTQDQDLSKLGSKLVQDVGEVDMSDPNTLVDFATWAMKTYPADKYAIILSDHGMGWPGGLTDPTSDGRSAPDAPLAQYVDNMMYLSDIDSALVKIRSNTGIDKFDMVGLDACLMSGVEVLDALAPSARYAVASEETEPSLGFAYASFLNSLKADPGMSGGELAQKVVTSYINDDQRIVDDSARNAFTGSRSSASQVSQQLSRDVTLSAIDLGGVPTLMSAINELAYDFQQVDQQPVAQARQYAQAYTNVFDDNAPSPYIDLGNFVQLLKKNSPTGNIATAIDKVQSAIGGVVLSEKHGADKPGSTGVSIYFPNSALYKSPASGPQSYTKIANRFATDSVWDQFLTFHYTGAKFTQAANIVGVPGRNDTITSPAAGVTVSAITASGNSVSPGQTITLRADVTGKNVGYIKLFTGYMDKASNSIDIVDTDYLESPNTQQVGGVYYPNWGTTGQFTIQFQFDPIVFGITDGTKTVQALLSPNNYGASSQDAVYTVDGMYTFASSGDTKFARLFFRDGSLQQVVSFTGQDSTGAASGVTPQKGDKFQVYEKWLELDANGQAIDLADQPGDTLTFGNQTFTWKSLDAAAGDYVVGFIVEDIDGNQYPTYTDVTIK